MCFFSSVFAMPFLYFNIVYTPLLPIELHISFFKVGVCFLASECTAKGGTAEGECAKGYGVCCQSKNFHRRI